MRHEIVHKPRTVLIEEFKANPTQLSISIFTRILFEDAFPTTISYTHRPKKPSTSNYVYWLSAITMFGEFTPRYTPWWIYLYTTIYILRDGLVSRGRLNGFYSTLTAYLAQISVKFCFHSCRTDLIWIKFRWTAEEELHLFNTYFMYFISLAVQSCIA